MGAIHASILEKHNRELLVKVASLEKPNAELTKTNSNLVGSVLPKLNTVANTVATKEFVKLTATATTNQITAHTAARGTSDIGPFSAKWTINVTDLLKTCTKKSEGVVSEKFTPYPQMTLQLSCYPHGYGGSGSSPVMYLNLLDGASWQKGEIEWEVSAGQNKFPKKDIPCSWTDNSLVQGFGPGDILSLNELKRAKTLIIVIRHWATSEEIEVKSLPQA